MMIGIYLFMVGTIPNNGIDYMRRQKAHVEALYYYHSSHSWGIKSSGYNGEIVCRNKYNCYLDIKFDFTLKSDVVVKYKTSTSSSYFSYS